MLKAARQILALGPKTIIIKKGEYGAVMLDSGGYFHCPAYPLEDVIDPTGALTRLKQYAVGRNPNWVEIVDLP